MKVTIVKPNEYLKDHIQKITIFRTLHKIIYQQKITVSPFSCLSYNHYDIPDFKVKSKVIKQKNKIQLTGPKTDDNIYALHNGKLSQVLIELNPSSFYYLFGQSPASIVNKTVALSNFIPESKSSALLECLVENNNSRSHIRKLSEFLVDKMTSALPAVGYIDQSIKLIDNSSGNITVRSVCDQVNKSDRQFNRKFNEVVGIRPIQYIKIRQLHFVINRIHRNHFHSIKELAYDTGFYDPAHFANSFKKLTGMTPGDFIQSDEHIALDYFSELI